MCLHNRTHILLRIAFGTLLSWLALAGTSTALDTSGTVSLAWTPNPEADVAGYTVHYGSASGNLSQRLQVNTLPAATVSGLEPGSTYYFAVQAFNTAGLNSLLSSEISYVVPVPDAPEISLQQASGNPLVNAQSSINLGSVTVGGATAAEVITITNLGTSVLTGLAVTTTGQDFAVSSLAATTLAPGASTDFNVTFSPSAAGTRSASVLVASNDADENPFEIHFAGTGLVAPEIAIEQSGGVNLTDGAANIHFSNSAFDTTGTPVTFTIRNSGNAALTGLATNIGGTGSGDFVVSAPAMITLAPGATTTFQVAFKPTVSGTRTATLHVASNDADENPFDIVLSGTGLAFPFLSVQQADGTPLDPNTSVIPFDSVVVGATGPARTYIVRNTGTAALTGLYVIVTDADAASFDLVAPPVTSLAPGDTTTFTVAFKPVGHGFKTAAIHVGGGNLATSQAPFEIGVTGDGVGIPEISIVQGSELASGSAALDFGNQVIVTGTSSKDIIIKNIGTADLTGLAVASSGPATADFKVGTLAATTLPPGESGTFKVNFKPSAAGARTAQLKITSNDADESLFTIVLSGVGVASPEIKVLQASTKDLKDGSAFVNLGTTVVASTSTPQILTIRNTGTATLSNLAITKNGPHSSDFTISALKVKSLAPGASTTLKVSFKPSKTGIRWGAIHISSNDSDEKFFDIVLTGTGKAAKTSTKTPTVKALSALAASPPSSSSAAPVAAIEVIAGRKYRTLTINKSSGTILAPGDIQVSSNLLDWFSGKNHTITLLDNATTIKVRDNIAVTQETKRYIRLNPAAVSK